jgi:hypothetical protein
MGILPEDLTALLVEGRFPSDWYAVIVDRNGLIISRQPDPEKFVGRPLTSLRDLVGYVDEGWGTGRTREGIDVYRSFSSPNILDGRSQSGRRRRQSTHL